MQNLPNLDFDFKEAVQAVPHDKRWDILKPELYVLFHSDADYSAIAQYMKAKYGFDAQLSAYKYRFKKWAWKRSIPGHKKDAILDYTQQRAVQGKRTASATFGKTPVDAKRLKRHVDSNRNVTVTLSEFRCPPDLRLNDLKIYLPSGLRPFSMWMAPLGGTSISSPPSNDVLTNTPSDFDFRTPSDTHLSPGISSSNHPSPLSSAVLRHSSNKRAKLFTQGKFIELIQTMDDNQQKNLSNWLYQFWFFAFKSAKDWGPYHHNYDAESLEFGNYPIVKSSKARATPHRTAISPAASQASGSVLEALPVPTDLCQWSIHVSDDAVYFDDDIGLTANDTDAPHIQPEKSFTQHLQTGLQNNQFSTFSAGEIPINLDLFAQATASSPQVLFEESLSFMIMAQNYEGLLQIVAKRRHDELRHALKNIRAMHTVTSYLNGGRTCCNILNHICAMLGRDVNDAYENDYGYTVLDNLMLTILKSHSTAAIECVDDGLSRGTRYAGIEVDICGRWTADSPCFRLLVATGTTSIPHQWKHKFCNTSVQAICHCIQVLSYRVSVFNDRPSGLFQKLCTSCGTKLQMQPLHSLILVAYVLANNARPNEDLFGIIACFLCLLQEGADPLYEANVSISALFLQGEPSDDCTHESMTPYALMQSLSKITHEPWPRELEIGWNVFSEVCKRAENGRSEVDQLFSDETASENDDPIDELYLRLREHVKLDCDHPYHETEARCEFYFGSDQSLCHLWAAVQAEFLNYRRIDEIDSWLSDNFNMAELAYGFEHLETPGAGYYLRGMLGRYCMCARFEEIKIPLREDVSKRGWYYSNMDCWQRASFIPRPDFELYLA